MRFHEFSWKNIKLSKITLFLVQMWDSSIIHALLSIFIKKYQTFKVHSFPSSDVRFKYYSCAFINFHEKISNFQSSLLSHFRCEIQVLFFKNIKLSKLTLFLVQMWDSSIILQKFETFKVYSFPSSDVIFKYTCVVYALSWIFMKKYQTFKNYSFPSSDVRFKYYSCAFINFH